MWDTFYLLMLAVLCLQHVSYGITSSTDAHLYYVRPGGDPAGADPDDLCPQPCYTLSEYQSMSTDDSFFTYTGTPNTTRPDVVLTFLAGRHILDGALNVTGVNSFTMTGMKENDNDPTVIANNGKISIQNVREVHLSQLCFTFAIKQYSQLLEVSAESITLSMAQCTVANSSGGFMSVSSGGNSVVTITRANFMNNSRFAGFVVGSLFFNFSNNIVANNSNTSLVTLTNCTSYLSNNTLYNNTGHPCLDQSVFVSKASTVVLQDMNRFEDNKLVCICGKEGSHIVFEGETVFTGNEACSGPVVGLRGTNLNFTGNTSFLNNAATFHGGAITLSADSLFNIFDKAMLQFENNRAGDRGGAIYIDGRTECFTTPRPCFLQFIESSANDLEYSLTFVNNFAVVAGDDIYVGSDDSCWYGDPLNQLYLADYLRNDTRTTIQHDNATQSSIASYPDQICLCNDKEASPPIQGAERLLFPGQNLRLQIMAIGHGFGTTPAVVIVSPDGVEKLPLFRELDMEGKDDKFCIRVKINATCTSISFPVHVHSQEPSQTFRLFPQEACNIENALSIHVNLSTTCPPGFELQEQTCTCDNRLQTLDEVRCDINQQTFQHTGDVWVGYSNTTANKSGLIIHSSPCPFDYCIQGMNVTFRLNETDKQCAHNRSGLLCGRCAEGLSVVLGGSSQCQKCSNAYLALLIPFALAGPALLFFLFFLKFTVIQGTLGGFIFYVNMVQVHKTYFFPAGHTNFLTVFIAWLNLDWGIDTCFYNQMDAYARVWLQFVFPLYICALTILIIVLSKYSKHVTTCLGHNPVAVLSTYLLFSHLRMFCSIIAVVMPTTLQYPDSVSQSVWRLDGNITFSSGKYLVLFLFAIAIFLGVFLPYTILLLFGQWLPLLSHWRLFSWANSPRLRIFLDPYHAPFKNRHRYWTGLLLVLRIFSALVKAFADIFANKYSVFISMLAIELVALLVLSLGWSLGGVYTKWPLDALESSFFFNLGLLALATYHVEANGGSQAAVTYTSVSIAFATFIGIVIYHTYIVLRSSRAVHWLIHQKRKNTFAAVQIEVPAEMVNTRGVPYVRNCLVRESLLDETA